VASIVLKNQSPDALDLTARCPTCGSTMFIKLIEPHPAVDWLERHTFYCDECGFMRKYTLGKAT
jgi:hypothetical protein